MNEMIADIAEAKREAERNADAAVFFAMLEAALLHADIIDAEARQRIAVLEQKLAALEERAKPPQRVSLSPQDALAIGAATGLLKAAEECAAMMDRA